MSIAKYKKLDKVLYDGFILIEIAEAKNETKRKLYLDVIKKGAGDQ